MHLDCRLALPVLFLTIVSYAFAEQPGAVTIKEESNHLSVSIEGKPFTDYWFGKREDRPYARPFFVPVLAPDGTPAQPTLPSSSLTVTATVGFPRESRISWAATALMRVMPKH